MSISNERADMIRDVWQSIREKVDFRVNRSWVALEPFEYLPISTVPPPPEVAMTRVKTIEFRHETLPLGCGTIMHRVVCEGVPVEGWTGKHGHD